MSGNENNKVELSFDEDKKALNKISREDYDEIFGILKDNVWDYGGGLTLADIRDGINNKVINNTLAKELESEEDIVNLLNKKDKDYSSDESDVFIQKVKASNVTEISESGYFYKKLASCMDNVNINKEDCESEGECWDSEKFINIDSLSDEEKETLESDFEFNIKDMNINEFNTSFSDFKEFIEALKSKNIDHFHVRTPITCKLAKDRCFCRKCCGKLSSGGRELEYKNIGILATLAITENVTQSCLSSMNNGIEENANKILEQPFELKSGSFEDFVNIISSLCEKMKSVGVQRRWYEIALLGRIYKEGENIYKSCTFVTSSKCTNDPMGAFLFSPGKENLRKLLYGGNGSGNLFEIESCKAKNLFGLF